MNRKNVSPFSAGSIIALAIFCSISLPSLSSAQELLWNTELQMVDTRDILWPVTHQFDADGNLTVASKLQRWHDMAGIYLFKVSPEGDLIWNMTFAAEGENAPLYNPSNIVFDNANNVYSLLQSSDYVMHLIKINGNGELLWQRNLNQVFQIDRLEGPGLSIDENGRIWAVCDVPNRDASVELFIGCFSPENDVIETYQFHINDISQLFQVKCLAEGIVIAGTHYEGRSSRLSSRMYDYAGQLLWQTMWGDRTEDMKWVETLSELPDGNLIMSWTMELQQDFYHVDHNLMKINIDNGEALWSTLAYHDAGGPSPAIDYRTMVSNDGGDVYSGGTVHGDNWYAGGFLTYKVNSDDGEIIWLDENGMEEDEVHDGGMTSGFAELPSGDVVVTGYAPYPMGIEGDEGHSLAILYYDSFGDIQSLTLERDADNWRTLEGRLAIADDDGNVFIPVRKARRLEDLTWVWGFEIRKYAFEAVEPSALAMPDILDIGEVVIGESHGSEFIIANNGQGSGRIYRVDFEEFMQDQFDIDTDLTLVIAPESQDTLIVTWTPVEEGEIEGYMKIFHNDEQLDNPLWIRVRGDAWQDQSVVENPRLPATIYLGHSYPNPFNSTTRIAFGLPSAARVNVSVFDMTGRLVATLADATFDAGSHAAVWNADAAPAGLYMVKMQAGSFSETRKLTLVK